MSYYPLMGCQEYAGFSFVHDNMGSPADHEKIRSLIEAEIIEVEATIASLEKALEPRESDCGIGRMVSPDSQPDTQTAEVALRLATKRLEKLRQATQRLNQPDFDKCRLCQKT